MSAFKPHQKNFTYTESGIFLFLAPFILVIFVGFSALVVDIGAMRTANAQLHHITDAAALATVTALPDGNDAAKNAGFDIITQNNIIGDGAVQNIVLELGQWDKDNRVFTPTEENPNAARVQAETTPPLFFSQIMGTLKQKTSIATTSVAVSGTNNRDIIILLDAGRNMNIYSSYRSRGITGSAQNFSLSMTRGVLNGPNTNIPCCYPSPCSSSLCGTALLDNQRLIGKLRPGADITNTSTDYNSIKSSMKWTDLTTYQPDSNGNPWVAPYPFGTAGSWSDYINYVKTDSWVNSAGQRHHYWTPTFASYLMDRHPTDAPMLWGAWIQPWSSTRIAIRDFIANDVSANDQVGLILFNGPTSNSAVLERELAPDTADDIDEILSGRKTCSSTSNPYNPTPPCTVVQPGRQPAHYSTTSIMLPGLQMAIDELINHGREGTQKIIFLFSTADFNANPIATLQPEITRAIENEIIIHTIGFEYVGRPDLLQSNIATATGGQHFVVPYPGVGRQNGAIVSNWPFIFSDVLGGWLQEGSQPQLVE